jgi:Bifunctional DNA primase/polymerase, N-terminal
MTQLAREFYNKETSRQAARRYIARGWKPLPVNRGNKGPTSKGWPEWQVTNADEYVREHFTSALPNVAIQLGKLSAGLTDVDLDCPEAVQLAPEFLPKTQSVFGRKSKRRAHHFYITNLYETESRAAIAFSEPEAMLVELRIGAGHKGAATLAPPSVHPNGEDINWDVDGDPAEVSGDHLKERVALLAAATLLVRHYPPGGRRQTAALVLGGVLARAHWTKDHIAWFVGVIAEAAGDDEIGKRVDAATGAVERLADGDDTPGLPRMVEEWTEEIANRFGQWIGYDGNGAPAGKQVSGTPNNQTNQLIELAADAELFHSKDSICYADVEENGHLETWPLTSDGFAQWLRHKFYTATGGAPNSQSLTAALKTLEAQARYDGPTHEAYVRCAAIENRVYLDLCDPDWHEVEIDASGWRVVVDAPVRFLRRRGMFPLPMPVAKHTAETRREAIYKLSDYVNVATEKDFCLLIMYLLAALSSRGPFPVLVLMGEPGSAKSTLERLIKELVDPNKAPLRSPPREARDMFIAANNSYLIAFDNFSDLPEWLSDMLCRLSTGGGFGTRRLYTDEEEMLFDAMRPVVLTCVDNVVIRGDLTDRAIFLTLSAIPEDKRRHERDFWAAFERDKPAILGALLDILALGLRELPHVKLAGYPRMADFALLATACEKAATDALWDVGLFADAYAMNRASATQSVIEEDLVADAIRRLMARRSGELWEGGAAELLEELTKLVGDVQQNKHWPKATNALARRMNKAGGVLRKIGIEIKQGLAKKTNRRIWMIDCPPQKGREAPMN